MSALPQLPGVDRDTALRRLRGNVAQYRRFLESYVRKYSHAQADLEGLLQQGDRVAAHRYAHSLKGLAAAIGADALAWDAQALESALKGPDTAPLQPLLAPLGASALLLLQAIEQDPTRPAAAAEGNGDPLSATHSLSPPAAATVPTVLVVDDVAENIEVLHSILESRYRIKVATQGERALAIALSDEPPDLILLDILMPGMDGYEVCRRIKADPAHRGIPILFVTATQDPEDESRGLALGAADFITKPFHPDIVLARVSTHLALGNQARELERMVDMRTRSLQNSRLQLIERLGKAATCRDFEASFHVTRMARYAQRIALAAGLTESLAEMILRAAPLHDIGKIATPDAVLLKPGRLDAMEWTIMQQHAATGADIIGDHDDPVLAMARSIAASHHERWDGCGYPAGLSAEGIPLAARIVAIADVFDALSSSRPYKSAWPVEKARQTILADAGRHFDPALVPAFERALPAMLEIRDRYPESLVNGFTQAT